MARRNTLQAKALRRQARREKRIDLDAPVDLLGTIRLLHTYLDASLCKTVFGEVRTTQRQRKWTLAMLAEFWTEVILRAPKSLTQALEKARAGFPGRAPIEASSESFFQRCKSLKWEFFDALFREFSDRILDVAPATFAPEFHHLRERFPEMWAIDGSRLDAVRHRLKILWNVRSVILPGCISVAYDLFRGIPRRLMFDPNAATAEMERTDRLIPDIPEKTLLVGDRLYASVALFQDLTERNVWGVFRLNGVLSMKKEELLSRVSFQGGILEDWLVEVGSGQTAPKQTLRYIRFKKKGVVHELLTNVLYPQWLSAKDAIGLYPLRWNIERMFYDLKEVLNLHRFYAGNPNAVAMQVYAAALVYTAMRVSQSHIAQKINICPSLISTEKFFPRTAAAFATLNGIEIGFNMMKEANPNKKLVTPKLTGRPFVTVRLRDILVEKRSGVRRRRRFCKARKRWKSFFHVSGGRKLC